MLTVVRFEEFLDDRIGKEVMAKVRPKARALMMKEFDEFVRGPPPPLLPSLMGQIGLTVADQTGLLRPFCTG